jgi:hypothetical protein
LELPMSLEKKDKVIIPNDKLQSLFQWRDNNKELVRKFTPILEEVVILLDPERKGYVKPAIYVNKSDLLPLYHHKFTFYLDGEMLLAFHWNRDTMKAHFEYKNLPKYIVNAKDDPTLEHDYIQSIISTYSSLSAFMEHHREVIVKTDVSRQQVKKKGKKGKQKNKVTYIRNTVYKFEGAMITGPEKRSYTPPTDPFKVRGHWKNVACGKGRMERKRVWVPGYTKNEQDGKLPEAKTYKV